MSSGFMTTPEEPKGDLDKRKDSIRIAWSLWWFQNVYLDGDQKAFSRLRSALITLLGPAVFDLAKWPEFHSSMLPEDYLGRRIRPVTRRRDGSLPNGFQKIGNLVSPAMMMRHFMQGRDLHGDLKVWVHPGCLTTTSWVAIDVDAKKEGLLPRAKEVAAIVLRTLGEPEFKVTSRGGRGFNLWYPLRRPYPGWKVHSVISVLMLNAGLGKTGKELEVEVFPKKPKGAFTAIPWGMNSYTLDEDLEPIRVPAEISLINWFDSYTKRNRRLRYLDFDALDKKAHKLPKWTTLTEEWLKFRFGVVDQQTLAVGIKKRHSMARSGAQSPNPTAQAPKIDTVSEIDMDDWTYASGDSYREIDRKFGLLDSVGITGSGQRRQALLLMAHWTRRVCAKGVDESIDFCVNWMSNDRHAFNDFHTYPSRTIGDIRHLCSTLFVGVDHRTKKSNRVDGQNPSSITAGEFKAIVQKLLRKTSTDGQEVSELDQQISHQDFPALNRLELRYANARTDLMKAMLSLTVHLYAHARANPEPGIEAGSIRTKVRSGWLRKLPYATRNPAPLLELLDLLGMVHRTKSTLVRPIRSYFFLPGNFPGLSPSGSRFDLKDRKAFNRLCAYCLTDQQGPLFFGSSENGWPDHVRRYSESAGSSGM